MKRTGLSVHMGSMSTQNKTRRPPRPSPDSNFASLVQLAVAASRRRVESVSLVRETTDGVPIGWILRFGSMRDNDALVTVFAGPGDEAGSSFRYYRSGESLPAEQVTSWLQTLAPAPVDKEISTLFEQALNNGWEVDLERRDNSFHSFPTPDLLTLRAEAHDYERERSRDAATVIASRHEGDEEFAAIMRDSYERGSYRPLHISLAEATALLNNPAPMTVGTHVYDEDKEEWVLPAK